MATDPSQWRQIALLDALGKAVHRLVREKVDFLVLSILQILYNLGHAQGDLQP